MALRLFTIHVQVLLIVKCGQLKNSNLNHPTPDKSLQWISKQSENLVQILTNVIISDNG